MKILVLSNLYPPHYVGGYELHCQIVAEGLRARGHKVQVLASDYRVQNVGESPAKIPVERSLKIHGMFGHPWLGIGQLEKLELHNNETLRAAIRRFSPDLVYVWNMGGLSKSMLFTLQLLKIPTDFCVCDHWVARSADGDVWLNWWNRKDASLKHRVLHSAWSWSGHRRKCDKLAPTNPIRQLRFPRIHFCSAFLRDFTKNAGYDVGQGAAIHCPIRIKLFEGNPRPASEPMTRLLYAGRLHADKGVMTALKALALLRNKFAGQLTLCGRGDDTYETELKNFVHEQKLPVEFTSVSRPEEMNAVYHAHHALLFTSEWAEPFGMTWAEAMASGLPVICTRLGGSTEVLRDHENALTYTPGNVEELARCILELDQDSALRAKIATAGYHEIRSRLDETNIVNQIATYLQETVKTWKPIELRNYSDVSI